MHRPWTTNGVNSTGSKAIPKGGPLQWGRISATWDDHKRTRGSKLHAAIDTFGQVLALHVTLAKTDDRAAMAALVDAVQEATVDNVDLAYVDRRYTKTM